MNSDLNHTNQAPYLFYCQIGRNFLLPFAKSKANSLYLLVSKVNKRRGKILKSYYLDFFSFKKISFILLLKGFLVNKCMSTTLKIAETEKYVPSAKTILLRSNMESAKIRCFWIHMWYLNCGDFKCVSFSNFH